MKKVEISIRSRQYRRRTVGYWVRGLVGALIVVFVGWWMLASIATALW
jgi:hypothetical protein